MNELKLAVHGVFGALQQAERTRKPDVVVTKPVALKQLCLYQKEREKVTSDKTELSKEDRQETGLSQGQETIAQHSRSLIGQRTKAE